MPVSTDPLAGYTTYAPADAAPPAVIPRFVPDASLPPGTEPDDTTGGGYDGGTYRPPANPPAPTDWAAVAKNAALPAAFGLAGGVLLVAAWRLAYPRGAR